MLSVEAHEPHPSGFYLADPVDVARRLLGSRLIHRLPDGAERSGRIVETEAYRGEEDLACHASAGLTKRTETMYGPPGHAYVYLIYGMYHMLNAVTWPEGRPSAVLIRALEPLTGIEGKTDGPGKLTRAMGIDMSHNRTDLTDSRLVITPDYDVRPDEIATGPRIGVDYAGEWAARPWRFCLRESAYLSRS